MKVDLISKLPKFLSSQLKDTIFLRQQGGGRLSDSSDRVAGERTIERSNIFDGQLISSRINPMPDYPDLHRVILDLDFECELVPSSTAGRYHLYTNKFLSSDKMDTLVNTLADLDILNRGIVECQWEKHGELSLRLPWVVKGEDKSFREQQNEG